MAVAIVHGAHAWPSAFNPARRLSELRRDEIILDMTSSPRPRTLDQLAFSHALNRHMKARAYASECSAQDLRATSWWRAGEGVQVGTCT